MRQKIVNAIFFITMTVGVWLLDFYYAIQFMGQLLETMTWFTVLYIFFQLIVVEIGIRRINDTKIKYSFRKSVKALFYLTFIAATVRIWVQRPEALLVSYGVIAAGLAVALQDLFKNIAGGIIIMLNNVYRVGDRVEINDRHGDIIDIGILYTTLLETRGWFDADQNTGRITSIPNGFILKDSFVNYTKDHNFVWDQLHIPVTYDSNWQKALEVIQETAKIVTESNLKVAENQIKRLRRKYYIQNNNFEPVTLVEMTDNWISIYLRYVTDARARARTRDQICRRLLELLEQHPDIKVASATFDIVGFPPVEMKKK